MSKDKTFKPYPTLEQIGTALDNAYVMLAEQHNQIVRLTHTLNGMGQALAWCLAELKHPMVEEAARAAEQTTDAGIVLPPDAGKIVLTDK